MLHYNEALALFTFAAVSVLSTYIFVRVMQKKEGIRMIRRISHFLCNYENIVPLFAGACALIFLAGILMLPLSYEQNQLYPKTIDRNSSLDPVRSWRSAFYPGHDPFAVP